MDVSFDPDLGAGKNIGNEGVAGTGFRRERAARENVRVHFASERRGKRAQPGSQGTQADRTDHEHVHIARRNGGSGGGRTEDKGHLDAGYSFEGGGKLLAKTGRFDSDASQLREDRMRGIGAVVKAVAIATRHKQVGTSELGDLLLDGAQGEVRVT